MEAIGNWTREYFLNNQELCLRKLKNDLSVEDKINLKANLNFKESGSLVLVNHCFVTDIRETEFYCEKYEVKKKSDGSTRIEQGKYSDKLNILDDDESCENPMEHLAERQVCIIKCSETNNDWIKEYEKGLINSNKRKIECGPEQNSYLVKVYDNPEIILNELVEVIGFLYPTPQYTSDSMETEAFKEEEQLPSYSIHALYLKKVSHNNPLLLHEIHGDNELIAYDETHKDLLKMLTQVMFGDELCARYFLCHLISNIYSRVNDEAIGKFTLNLICQSIPSDLLKEFSKKIYNLLEVLLPNSMHIPMTIENLNTCDFVPKKDYTTNKLTSGLLQLPKSTHILLDETQLENGKLDHSGCLAISHFSELIRSQQLSYDFQYYKIPYKTDTPVLIVSEGKSLLPSDFALPIKVADPDSIRLINENFAAAMHYIRPKLNTFRVYLTKCRLQSFDISDERTKMIEEDFVKMRENSSNFEVEGLHQLLVLSRLVGISKGIIKLDTESWEMAKQMEAERIARLEKRNSQTLIEP